MHITQQRNLLVGSEIVTWKKVKVFRALSSAICYGEHRNYVQLDYICVHHTYVHRYQYVVTKHFHLLNSRKKVYRAADSC